MQQSGAFPEHENIILFYSDDGFSFQKDGNGFTKNHVFSYWDDETNGLTVVSEKFSNIKDIKVEYANNNSENTTIKIISDDDSDFILYVSREEGRDREFVGKLNEQWKTPLLN